MEDIFAVDDYDVDIAPRPQIRQASPSFALDNDSHLPGAGHTTLQQQNAPRQARGDDEDEFNFDYLPARRAVSPPAAPFDLGLDEEVVVKKRLPRAKLDEERLLGENGIPKIRDELSKKIKFRGKGHELADLGKFIEHYQFWAHQLFPKAKFRDAVKIIGKVGKTKSMKAARRQIITDALPRPEYLDGGNSDSEVDADRPATIEAATTATMETSSQAGRREKQDLFVPDNDEFELSDFEQVGVQTKASARPAQGPQGLANDVPDEMPMEEANDVDDMDALEAMGWQM